MEKLILTKMASINDAIVEYSFVASNLKLDLNSWIGKRLTINYTGNIFCIKCGRKTNKSFAQGYCYPCFITVPETEDCVLRPELCKAHEGIARDLEYAREHCLSSQYVYLASSGSIKVGVTRKSQIPARWIDQGASYAAIIAEAPNRFTAGIIEVEMKKYMTDKTDWRAMLCNRIDENPKFNEAFELAKNMLPGNLKQYLRNGIEIVSINYPVLRYPQKVISIDLEKIKTIEGYLEGIKGQYIILDGGRVMNIRKYSGYEVEIDSFD